jgi:hypothetical protein
VDSPLIETYYLNPFLVAITEHLRLGIKKRDLAHSSGDSSPKLDDHFCSASSEGFMLLCAWWKCMWKERNMRGSLAL